MPPAAGTRRSRSSWQSQFIGPAIERARAAREKSVVDVVAPSTEPRPAELERHGTMPRHGASPIPDPTPRAAATPRQLAVVHDYAGLQAALRERCAKLGISRLELDRRAGLAEGHAGKLLGAGQVKRFGHVSLGSVLEVLGLALVVVEQKHLSE